MSFLIRPATIDDAQVLFDWRNDEVTRANSINTNPVEWDGHVAWLGRVVDGSNPNRALYVVETDEGDGVGTVRTDRTEDGAYEISYTVAPAWRGKGVGKAMVVQFAQEHLTGEKILATIKKGHVPSESIARALGLSPVQEIPSEDATDPRPMVEWR